VGVQSSRRYEAAVRSLPSEIVERLIATASAVLPQTLAVPVPGREDPVHLMCGSLGRRDLMTMKGPNR
jgi:hypothetical protein